MLQRECKKNISLKITGLLLAEMCVDSFWKIRVAISVTLSAALNLHKDIAACFTCCIVKLSWFSSSNFFLCWQYWSSRWWQGGGSCMWCSACMYWPSTLYPKPGTAGDGNWAGQQGQNTNQQQISDKDSQVSTAWHNNDQHTNITSVQSSPFIAKHMQLQLTCYC